MSVRTQSFAKYTIGDQWWVGPPVDVVKLNPVDVAVRRSTVHDAEILQALGKGWMFTEDEAKASYKLVSTYMCYDEFTVYVGSYLDCFTTMMKNLFEELRVYKNDPGVIRRFLDCHRIEKK